MAAPDPHLVTDDDLGPLAPGLGDLVGTGRGWVNLVRDTDDDRPVTEVRTVPGMLFGRIGGRGPVEPRVTWTPARPRRRGEEPAMLGIEHGAGPRAARRLAELGHAVPAGWRVAQDNPLRGLVVELPTGTDPQQAIRWALGAATALAPSPGTGRWRAEVHPG